MTPSVVVVVGYDASGVARASGLRFYGGSPDTWVDMDTQDETEAIAEARMLFGEQVVLPDEWRRTHPFIIDKKILRPVKETAKAISREDALANRGMKQIA